MYDINVEGKIIYELIKFINFQVQEFLSLT